MGGLGQSPWSGGQSPPEAKAFLAFGRSVEAANLPTFQYIGNTKTSDVCVIFAKNHGWLRNWERRLEQNWGPVIPGPALKPPLIVIYSFNVKLTSATFNNASTIKIHNKSKLKKT